MWGCWCEGRGAGGALCLLLTEGHMDSRRPSAVVLPHQQGLGGQDMPPPQLSCCLWSPGAGSGRKPARSLFPFGASLATLPPPATLGGGNSSPPLTLSPSRRRWQPRGLEGQGTLTWHMKPGGSLALENSAPIPHFDPFWTRFQLLPMPAPFLYGPPILTRTPLPPSPPAQQRETWPALSPFLHPQPQLPGRVLG